MINAEALLSLSSNAAKATRLLKLMASEQRLMLLCKLSEGEMNVGDLAEWTGMTQSTTSQHLAKMRAEGLVETRRDAQTIFYRLENQAAKEIIDLLCKIYKS